MASSKVKPSPQDSSLDIPTWNISDNGSSQDSGTQPIGRYHSTEDALKHDLSALKKGEIYNCNEFYKRAKAWYKAEIDRMLHLQHLEQVIMPTDRSDMFVGYLSFPSKLPTNSINEVKAPTRTQPSRAAKRKLAQTTTAPIPKPPPATRRKTGTAAVSIGGDYTLAPYDWTRSLLRRDSNTVAAPSPITKPDPQPGLEVAYFSLRLQRATATKISQLLSSGYLQRRNAGKLRCALNPAGRGKKYRVPRESDFQPAAGKLPGEDWTSSSPNTPTFGQVLERFDTEGDVDVERSRTGTPAPEAPMEVSPTLGRWPVFGSCRPPGWLQDKAREQKKPVEKEFKATKQMRLMAEKLERDNLVEVGGLRFAVDLCQSQDGSEEGARFVML
ncbi:hypothetical protein B0T21DRAFT_299653 [Apiosordaria backusii]|uniref:Uncharacterized protein n=1 Tax=Apiosordaria backusii TaxID=314023 RepID=A0AA39ZSM8_9PEZI|nr:hypothetical protein B0T21DRAFT_299653 [Apiosordaria backusii]